LSLPAVAEKPVILTMTYAVVVFSIVVQGLTMKPLVKRMIPPEDRASNDEGGDAPRSR